jgi:hypothetical protein
MRSNISTERACLCFGLALACLANLGSHAQATHAMHSGSPAGSIQSGPAVRTPRSAAPAVRPAITLDPPAGWELQVHAFDATGKPHPEAPANFRRLGTAGIGEVPPVHTLTLRITRSTRVKGISTSKDFKVEPGGTCAEGAAYEKDATCTVRVRFTPQGPGHRLGKLTVATTDTVTPDYGFGLGGEALLPAVSFIPALITTVSGTNLGAGTGLLTGAGQLAIDGADNLYVADTGHSKILYLDSSGDWQTIFSDLTNTVAPYGIGVDAFGTAWFSDPLNNAIYSIDPTGLLTQENGAGTDPCFAGSGCLLANEAVSAPGSIALDPATNVMAFANFDGNGLGVAFVQPYPPEFETDYDPFVLSSSTTPALGVDTFDNIYTSWNNGGCMIMGITFDDSENFLNRYLRIAGGRTCGFKGDGGLAGSARISANIGQIAFDAAGDLYFSDSGNQRVRRVDFNTGIIHTIAGDGIAGYSGDGGKANAAALNSPTGIAVDSQGAVYIISGTGTGSNQVVRKVGPQGRLNLGWVAVGSSSTLAATMTNTGNVAMQLSGTSITGPAASDFAVNPSTTTCGLTAGSQLQPGDTCSIAFTFTPSATGFRSANFTLQNNTAGSSSLIQLTGDGNQPWLNIKSPTSKQEFASGSSVTFTVLVTVNGGPAPTGSLHFDYGDGDSSDVPISSGKATVTVPNIASGTYIFSGSYIGDGTWHATGPVHVTYTID